MGMNAADGHTHCLFQPINLENSVALRDQPDGVVACTFDAAGRADPGSLEFGERTGLARRWIFHPIGECTKPGVRHVGDRCRVLCRIQNGERPQGAAEVPEFDRTNAGAWLAAQGLEAPAVCRE